MRKKKSNTKLTLLIPAYNEEAIILKTLDAAYSFLSPKGYKWEILVVDDGSSDKTAELVKKHKGGNTKLITLSKNQGKGAALRKGILASGGDFIIFSDADLSVDLANIDSFLKELKLHSVVIGSRRSKGAEIAVHQPWLRENMGRFFTFITKLVTGVGVSDFTCGFKGFRASAARKVFKLSRIKRWAYDAEILFLASKKFGFSIKEMPIKWTNREATRVVLLKAVSTSLRDLLKIRMYNLLGKYEI